MGLFLPPGAALGSDDLIELLFFAYRDFVADPDRILAEYGFGRAHHRVVHFVCRYPGLTVADLSNDIRPVAVSLAHVAARQEMRNLMMAMGLEQVLSPLDVAA